MELDITNAKERGRVVQILKAWKEYGLPKDFKAVGIFFGFNPDDGSVYLRNKHSQVAVYDVVSSRLVSFYRTPYAGYVGTLLDLIKLRGDSVEEDKKFHKLDNEFLDVLVEDRIAEIRGGR